MESVAWQILLTSTNNIVRTNQRIVETPAHDTEYKILLAKGPAVVVEVEEGLN